MDVENENTMEDDCDWMKKFESLQQEIQKDKAMLDKETEMLNENLKRMKEEL